MLLGSIYIIYRASAGSASKSHAQETCDLCTLETMELLGVVEFCCCSMGLLSSSGAEIGSATGATGLGITPFNAASDSLAVT